jgi:hypothetical protein
MSLFLVGIFLFSLIVPAVASPDIKSQKRIDIQKTSKLFNEIDLDGDYIDFQSLENQSYDFIHKLIGNDSNIGRCGKAFIQTKGKGFHIGRVRPLFTLHLPIRIYRPLWFIIPRRMCVYWLICSIYKNYENAQTIINPVNTNETIFINGSHVVIGGTFVFPAASRFNLILKGNSIFKGNGTNLWTYPILRKLLKNFQPKLEDFISKYHGKLFWYKFPYITTNNTLIDFILKQGIDIVNVLHQTLRSMIWPDVIIKISLLGLFREVDWNGYSPFFIWSKI